MKKIVDVVMERLTANEWNFEHPEDGIVVTGLRGNNSNFRVFFFADEERRTLQVMVTLPVVVPEQKRMEMAEFMTRANSTVLLGNFGMNFEDGEIRYSSAIDLGVDGELTLSMVDGLMMRCVITLDQYTPGIMKVIYANVTPQEAFEEITQAQA